jgi:hypothetical protein
LKNFQFQERAENYQPDTLPPTVSRYYLEYFKAFMSRIEWKGLVLVGSKGSGKTHTLLHYFLDIKDHLNTGFLIFNREKREFQNLRWEGNANLKNAKLLIVDDFHYALESYLKKEIDEEKLIEILRILRDEDKKFILVCDGTLRQYASLLKFTKVSQLLREIEEIAWQKEFIFLNIGAILWGLGIESTTDDVDELLGEIVTWRPRSLIRLLNCNIDFFQKYIDTNEKLDFFSIERWLQTKFERKGLAVPVVLRRSPEEWRKYVKYFTETEKIPEIPKEGMEEVKKAYENLYQNLYEYWKKRSSIFPFVSERHFLGHLYEKEREVFDRILDELQIPWTIREVVEFAVKYGIYLSELEKILKTAESLRKLEIRDLLSVYQKFSEARWIPLPLIKKILDEELYHPYHIKILESGRVVIEEE